MTGDGATRPIVFGDVRARAGLPPIAGGLASADELLFVAPANAASRNSAVVDVMRGESGYNLAAAGLPSLASTSLAQVQRQFSWRASAPHLLTPVVDQGTCGCCWAVAAAGTLSDRIAIRTKQNPHLPFQVLMACVASCELCGICDIHSAFQLLARKGVVAGPESSISAVKGEGDGRSVGTQLEAWGFPVRGPSSGSATALSGGGLRPVPASGAQRARTGRPKDVCAQVTRLLARDKGGASRAWRAAGPARRSSSILELKHVILRDGPVATIVRIYVDFVVGSDPRLGPAFAATEGVYVHTEGATNYGVPPKQNRDLGTHCMVIVGWGQTESGLEYWDVRNSWSTRWGDQGYCKIAMTAPSLANSSVGVDLAIVTTRGNVTQTNYGNVWVRPELEHGQAEGDLYGAAWRAAQVEEGVEKRTDDSTRCRTCLQLLAVCLLLCTLVSVLLWVRTDLLVEER